jgi:dCMP deaminase
MHVWDETFINICKEISKHSTCSSRKTAALLVCDKRIISMGYNGVPSGDRHCSDMTEYKPNHHEWSKNHEIHGEMNAILFAAKNGGIPKNTTMYTLTSPCTQCAKLILVSGISRVVFLEYYQRDLYGIKFLQKHQVEVCQINSEELQMLLPDKYNR